MLVAGAIVAMIGFQVFVNIGMTVGIMPITGIPLPLMSYGGSHTLTTLIAIGLLLGIHRAARPSPGSVGVVGPLKAGLKAVQPVIGAVRTVEAVVEERRPDRHPPGRPRGHPRGCASMLGSPAPAPDEDALAILAVSAATPTSRPAPPALARPAAATAAARWRC